MSEKGGDMTVEELIEELRKIRPEAQVVYDGICDWGSIVEVSYDAHRGTVTLIGESDF
jgi:hypothetical protein